MTKQRRKRLRKRLPRKPTWEGTLRGWAMKFALAQKWRTAPEHDLDDLMQEAYLLYRDLKVRYAHVQDPPHFMRLFQVSFRNFVHTLSSKRTRRAEVSATIDGPEGETTLFDMLEDGSGLFDRVELEILLFDAPEDVRIAALAVLDEGPVVYERIDGIRENRAERFQRLAGPEALPDVLGRLRQFIRETIPCVS